MFLSNRVQKILQKSDGKIRHRLSIIRDFRNLCRPCHDRHEEVVEIEGMPSVDHAVENDADCPGVSLVEVRGLLTDASTVSNDCATASTTEGTVG